MSMSEIGTAEIVRAKPAKPLGGKGYGSTPHLVGSRVGPADHSLTPEQSQLFTGGRPPRRGDRFILTEKADGSCVTVAKHGGNVLAITRAGYLASDSPWPLHHVFDRWVAMNRDRFGDILDEGDRIAGEWMHTAMGTRYHIEDPDDLFLSFALINGKTRQPYDEFGAQDGARGHPPRGADIGRPARIDRRHDGGPGGRPGSTVPSMVSKEPCGSTRTEASSGVSPNS
jgi:hypothetical protein